MKFEKHFSDFTAYRWGNRPEKAVRPLSRRQSCACSPGFLAPGHPTGDSKGQHFLLLGWGGQQEQAKLGGRGEGNRGEAECRGRGWRTSPRCRECQRRGPEPSLSPSDTRGGGWRLSGLRRGDSWGGIPHLVSQSKWVPLFQLMGLATTGQRLGAWGFTRPSSKGDPSVSLPRGPWIFLLLL